MQWKTTATSLWQPRASSNWKRPVLTWKVSRFLWGHHRLLSGCVLCGFSSQFVLLLSATHGVTYILEYGSTWNVQFRAFMAGFSSEANFCCMVKADDVRRNPIRAVIIEVVNNCEVCKDWKVTSNFRVSNMVVLCVILAWWSKYVSHDVYICKSTGRDWKRLPRSKFHTE